MPTAPRELESRMMRKYPVRFGGGPGEKAVMTSLAVYPTSCVAPASGSSSGLAFVRQAKLGASCGVEVPTG